VNPMNPMNLMNSSELDPFDHAMFAPMGQLVRRHDLLGRPESTPQKATLRRHSKWGLNLKWPNTDSDDEG
jgi:hypothetical protein